MGGDVLGIIPAESQAGAAGTQRQEGIIRLLLDLRTEARERKDWATADQIRQSLTDLGISLEDRADGTIWKIS